MTRSVRSTSNYMASLAFTLVTLAAALVATPLLLRWLGQEKLGAFRAASDWAGYLSLLELGLGGALLPLVAAAIHRDAADREQRLASVMSAAFRAYRRVTLLMLLGAAALVVAITFLVPTD